MVDDKGSMAQSSDCASKAVPNVLSSVSIEARFLVVMGTGASCSIPSWTASGPGDTCLSRLILL
jgi:hypothetical protein